MELFTKGTARQKPKLNGVTESLSNTCHRDSAQKTPRPSIIKMVKLALAFFIGSVLLLLFIVGLVQAAALYLMVKDVWLGS